MWNGEEHYQVSGKFSQYVVNMADKTCTCRAWEINGIPCRHAVAAIWNKALHGQVPLPETFVHPIYRMDTWKQVYSFKIFPINGKSMWPRSQVPTTILPPYYHKPIGRPKKARRKSTVELEEMTAGGRLRKVGTSGTCGKCGNAGHNSRSCNGRREDGGVGSTKVKQSKVKHSDVGSSKVKDGGVGPSNVKARKDKKCKICKGHGHNIRTCKARKV